MEIDPLPPSILGYYYCKGEYYSLWEKSRETRKNAYRKRYTNALKH
jgi:hypothetical protein